MSTDELAEQIADMQIELEALRRFKDLAVRAFEYPGGIDLVGLNYEERVYLRQAFEDYQQKVLEPRRPKGRVGPTRGHLSKIVLMLVKIFILSPFFQYLIRNNAAYVA